MGGAYSDALADFIGAMEAEGVKPVEPIAQRLSSGELIRFRCDGDGKGRQNGWAKLYLDERPAGAFGNYRLAISRKWRVDRDLSLTTEERAALQREWDEAKRRRADERARSEAEAANDAADLWGSAAPARADHAYLATKGIAPGPFRQAGNKVLVPMFDGDGRLCNLQRIGPDGSKRFLRGGRTAGLFFIFGEFTRRGETAYLGEGMATMHAVHRASGRPTIAAFSAKNLLPVGRLWWSRRPDLDLVVCADDDSHLPANIGREAAEATASEIGARVAYPVMAEA